MTTPTGTGDTDASRQHPTSGTPRAYRRPLLPVAAIAVMAGLLAWLVAPVGLRVGPATSGDPELAATVRAALDSDRGYQALHVSEITATSVRHAGIGAVAPGGEHALTATDPVELGSITKTFNGMLLADAIRRGEVAADDPVADHLTELQGTALGDVTLEELATHRGGVPPGPPSSMLRGLVGGVANLDLISRDQPGWVLDQVARMPRMKTVGQVVYSNLGATLLGWALAAAAGETTWRDHVAGRLLTPLGMGHTTFAATTDEIPAGAVPGRLVGGRRAVQGVSPAYQPAGCCTWTTAEDITRYAQAVLRGDAPGMDALGPLFPAGNAHGGEHSIGYHWFTLSVQDRTLQWHNGGTTGYHTMLAVDRQAGRAVLVVGNSTRPVDQLAIRLLTGITDDFGSTRSPAPVLGLALAALAVLLVGGAVAVGLWGRSRLHLVRAASGAVIGLSLARIGGPWNHVPGWTWAVAVAIAAAALALGVLRVRGRPWHRPRRGWLSWPGAALAVTAAGLAVALGAG